MQVADALDSFHAAVHDCRRCPRLVEWRERVAVEKRAAFRDQTYWGRPISGFGDPSAPIVLVGLAPAAHGGNRTGRIFTGDRSADFLFASMHRAGLANQAESIARDDGLELQGAYVTAAVRCAPPANRPLPAERDACSRWLRTELTLLQRPRVLVALGAFAWDAVLRTLDEPRPWSRFGHGAEAAVGPYTLLGTFHPSQQNTFTGKLTPDMLDAVFERAKAVAAEAPVRA